MHDGQALRFDTAFDAAQFHALGDDGADLADLAQWPHPGSPPLPSGSEPSVAHGLLGGYTFYEHVVNTRLLPLRRAVVWTSHLRRRVSKFALV